MAYTTEPQVPQSRAETRRRRLFVVGDGQAAPARAKIAVLYVEDDCDDVFLLDHQLRGLASFEVEFAHATTVTAARQAIEQRRYDVILCDFWLQSETTVSFIGELKAAAGATPVVMVSSLENDDIELIGRRAGADGFIAKADLSAASLDRVFNTLLAPRDRRASEGGATAWLKALMASLDRALAASRQADGNGPEDPELRELLDALFGPSATGQSEVLDQLAGLTRATEASAERVRFDVVPLFSHGIRRQTSRASAGASVAFAPPELPVTIEANPVLLGDLIDGFLAELGDRLAAGRPVDVGLSIADGRLTVRLTDVSVGGDITTATIVEAAVTERRLLVETLARAAEGEVAFHAAGAAVLTLPLRQRQA